MVFLINEYEFSLVYEEVDIENRDYIIQKSLVFILEYSY